MKLLVLSSSHLLLSYPIEVEDHDLWNARHVKDVKMSNISLQLENNMFFLLAFLLFEVLRGLAD